MGKFDSLLQERLLDKNLRESKQTSLPPLPSTLELELELELEFNAEH